MLRSILYNILTMLLRTTIKDEGTLNPSSARQRTNVQIFNA
jgi:hypothetical protein